MSRTEILGHRPIQGLRHGRVAFPVAVRESVAAGHGGSANFPQRGLIDRQPVTHVVEAASAAKMTVNHRHDMTPRREGPRLDSMFACQFDCQMPRNVLTNLTKDG